MVTADSCAIAPFRNANSVEPQNSSLHSHIVTAGRQAIKRLQDTAFRSVIATWHGAFTHIAFIIIIITIIITIQSQKVAIY
jgi:hypothetical protein